MIICINIYSNQVPLDFFKTNSEPISQSAGGGVGWYNHKQMYISWDFNICIMGSQRIFIALTAHAIYLRKLTAFKNVNAQLSLRLDVLGWAKVYKWLQVHLAPVRQHFQTFPLIEHKMHMETPKDMGT